MFGQDRLAVAFDQSLLAELHEVGEWRVALGHLEVWEERLPELDGHVAAIGDHLGIRDRLGHIDEGRDHILGRPE